MELCLTSKLKVKEESLSMLLNLVVFLEGRPSLVLERRGSEWRLAIDLRHEGKLSGDFVAFLSRMFIFLSLLRCDDGPHG